MFSKQPPSSPPLSWSAKAARTKESPISSPLAMALHDPNLISFAAGLVIDTGIQRLGQVVGELLETTPIVLGDSPGCCSLNPEPRTLWHE